MNDDSDVIYLEIAENWVNGHEGLASVKAAFEVNRGKQSLGRHVDHEVRRELAIYGCRDRAFCRRDYDFISGSKQSVDAASRLTGRSDRNCSKLCLD